MSDANFGAVGVLRAHRAFWADAGADFLTVGDQKFVERNPKALWHNLH